MNEKEAEISKFLLKCFKTLDLWGRTPEDMKDIKEIFIDVLGPYDLKSIRHGFIEWLRTSNKWPAPSDIIERFPAPEIEKPKIEDSAEGNIKNAFIEELGAVRYLAWFKNSEFEIGPNGNGNYLKITVKDDFAQDFLAQNYQEKLYILARKTDPSINRLTISCLVSMAT